MVDQALLLFAMKMRYGRSSIAMRKDKWGGRFSVGQGRGEEGGRKGKVGMGEKEEGGIDQLLLHQQHNIFTLSFCARDMAEFDRPVTPTKEEAGVTTTPAARPVKTPNSLKIEKEESREIKKELYPEDDIEVAGADDASGGGKTASKVSPWEVEGDIDYDRLIEQFGSSRLTIDIVERIERLTGHKAHRFLRRGIFFSHRDLTKLLDLYESGKKFYLYTGKISLSEAKISDQYSYFSVTYTGYNLYSNSQGGVHRVRPCIWAI